IAGAGFAGTVMAERIASKLGKSCLVVERRNHIGGNAYDHYDEAGVLLHDYGPHYFRTNSQRIIDYLSQFTDWHPVEYKILSWTNGPIWRCAINRKSCEQLRGRRSNGEEIETKLAAWRLTTGRSKSSEGVIGSHRRWKIRDKLFKNCTRQKWARAAKGVYRS